MNARKCVSNAVDVSEGTNAKQRLSRQNPDGTPRLVGSCGVHSVKLVAQYKRFAVRARTRPSRGEVTVLFLRDIVPAPEPRLLRNLGRTLQAREV